MITLKNTAHPIWDKKISYPTEHLEALHRITQTINQTRNDQLYNIHIHIYVECYVEWGWIVMSARLNCMNGRLYIQIWDMHLIQHRQQLSWGKAKWFRQESKKYHKFSWGKLASTSIFNGIICRYVCICQSICDKFWKSR